MEHSLFRIRLLFNVDGAKICDSALEISIDQIDVDVSCLIDESSEFIPVFLTFLQVIGGDSFLLQSYFSVFGFQVEIDLGWLLTRYFDVDNAFFTGIIQISFDLLDDLWLLVLLIILEILETFLIAFILSCAFLFLNVRETFVPDDFEGVLDWCLYLEVLGVALVQSYSLTLVKP